VEQENNVRQRDQDNFFGQGVLERVDGALDQFASIVE